jgi:hypothetical protein
MEAFLSAPCAEAASATTTFPSRSSVILGDTQASGLLHQCSRDSPQQVSGTWLPSSAQIAALEERLFPILRRELSRNQYRASKPEDYFRQYAGYVVGGRKFIYVNGVDRGYIKFLLENHIPGADWEREAIVICDGGEDFFGAEYDVETRSLRNLSFNGRA